MPENTRPRGKAIKVWVTEEEGDAIKKRAAQTSLSASSFLRALGLNEPIKSTTDQDAILSLMKASGDLGRLGGLLKLWLSESPGKGAPVNDVRQLLNQAQALQMEMRRIAGEVTKK
ncbi:plasmid mobilization protein [Erwinia amylovora]|uniref:plasmid mobilization protein n=1 Tax=Erwinia amylovora TaxID=552 RepID=UPI0014441FC0|nr:CopG family transcriptional regulator [Erwinia amylovora]